MKRISSICMTLLCSVGLGSSYAGGPTAEVDTCLRAAASKHGVHYALVRSIAEQESSFNPLAVRKPFVAGNSDASTDYGLMQINSSWLPTLKKHGITAQGLFNPCVNADVGVWILADNFRRLGVTWNAVGAYNAMTPWKRVKYANGVYNKLARFQGQRTTAYTTAVSHQNVVASSAGVATNQDSASDTNRGVGVYEVAE